MIHNHSYPGNQIPEVIQSQIIQFNLSLAWTKEQTLEDFENPFSEYFVALELEGLESGEVESERMDSGSELMESDLEKLDTNQPTTEDQPAIQLNSAHLIAYIALHYIFEEATINLVFVDPNYRRQGIAHKLLQKAEKDLVQNKVDRIILEVRASNLAAHKLYEKLGYKTLNVRKDYYQAPKEDAFILRKFIRKDMVE